jgi:hypothetical protein
VTDQHPGDFIDAAQVTRRPEGVDQHGLDDGPEAWSDSGNQPQFIIVSARCPTGTGANSYEIKSDRVGLGVAAPGLAVASDTAGQSGF